MPNVALLGQILSGNGPIGELLAEFKKDPDAEFEALKKKLLGD